MNGDQFSANKNLKANNFLFIKKNLQIENYISR